ncbi:hypothetical protein WJX84_000142 [Apatococcus fuscideae]|uniref:Fe2OG dioxygenase domain-containing protein n=1 Tax=Apatococcus fuscideae TaxID=2026836 RepID=A0AAW1TI09_9CHLO
MEAFDGSTAAGAALDVAREVSRQPASEALGQAAQIIDQSVGDRLASRAADLQPDDRSNWSSTYALANFYRDGQECVGAHADKMTQLGPRPIIASLSLGAGRVFRLRPSAAASPHQAREQGELSYIDIPLQHNMLVIMWPPCQEAWKHEIPRTRTTARHAISGEARVNLTFRRLKPEWAARAPLCRCSQRSVLRCSSKPSVQQRHPPGSPEAPVSHSRHSADSVPTRWAASSPSIQPRYYYTCDNTQGPGCGFWQAL